MGARQQYGVDEHSFSIPFLGEDRRLTVQRSAEDHRMEGFAHDRKNSQVERTSARKLTWRELLEEFTSNTTLHGIRYIFSSDVFVARRLIWLLLTITCSGLLVFQIVDRVLYYYDSPVTVNLKVNYNQSLLFPALTICNQNNFRATEARRLGWYRLIESMYSNSSATRNTDWLKDFNVSGLSLEELFLKLGHRKEDFIIKCTLADGPCSAENFSVTLTDHGVCYTFDRYDVNGDVIRVTNSGSDHGLKLTLNAEQYEAMPGPHDATGIKILATEGLEHPRVNEIGMAIPTGSHAFVGLGVVVISNLPKPHGDCGEVPLYSTEKYSKDACQLECITTILAEKCGCRHFYMPTIQEVAHNQAWQLCNCPTSCDYLLFDPDISYATTSVFAKDHLLQASKSEDLVKRFYDARETAHRMSNTIYTPFRIKVQVAAEAFEDLKQILVHSIQEKLQPQMEALNNVDREMSDAIETKRTIYKYQKYSLQKNFMRARDAMEERTFSTLCFGFHEFVFNSELALNGIFAMMRHPNKTESALPLYTVLSNTLKTKIETARKAYNNYTQLYNAYETGERIFNYKFQKLPREYNSYINPRPLLNESLSHNTYARRYAPRMGEDIIRVLNATQIFQGLVDEVMKNKSENFTERMKQFHKNFIDACEDYYHSKSTFYFVTINRPVDVIQDRLDTFKRLKQEYEKTLIDVNNTLYYLNDSLKNIRENFLEHLSLGINDARKYINDVAVSKRQLTEELTSKGIGDDIYSMQVFFNDLRQRGIYVYEMWSEVKENILRIWEQILNDKDSVEYYKFRKMNKFLRNISDVQADLDDQFSNLQMQNDLRFVIGNKDNVFITAIKELIEDLKRFQEGNEMNDKFVRNNFLQMDVYYKELRHEKIEQQPAYGVIALLCDIGGSMGLFIGASVMTLYEIIDLILNYMSEKAMRNINRRRKK